MGKGTKNYLYKRKKRMEKTSILYYLSYSDCFISKKTDFNP